jgi:hypothetical protein
MIQSFYQKRPTVDTPYRELVLEHKNEWQVRLLGGTKWGRENAEELRVVRIQDFDTGVLEYNKMFSELREQGWKPYSPQVAW